MGAFLIQKLAELQAYECSTPGQETDVKSRRRERKRNEKRVFGRIGTGKGSH